MDVLYAAAIFLSQYSSAWSCAGFLWRLWRRRRTAAPHHMPRRKSTSGIGYHAKISHAEKRAKLLYLCAHLDHAGCRTVAHVFNRWHGGWATIGKTAVWEFMRKHEAEIDERRRARKKQPPRAARVKESWALDLTFIRSPFGATFTVLAILDAGSRKLLRLRPGRQSQERYLRRYRCADDCAGSRHESRQSTGNRLIRGRSDQVDQ